MTVQAATIATTLGGTVVIANNGDFTYTPPVNVSGTDSFTYTVADNDGDVDLASQELRLALQENPLDSKAHFLLGSLLAWQGAEDQAIIGFQRTVRINPTNPEAFHNLGTLLLRRDQAIPGIQKQVVRRWRLSGKHIHRRARYPSGIQCFSQCSLINEGTATRVD